MLYTIKELSVEGYYSIFGDEYITGFLLWLIWLVEFLIVAGGGIFMVYSTYADLVYCENCKEWCEEKLKPSIGFGFPEEEKMLDKVLEGNMELLEQFPLKEKGRHADHISVDFNICPKCKSVGTFQLNTVSFEDDEAGKTVKNEDKLCDNYVIDKSTIDYFESMHRNIIKRKFTEN